MALSRCYVRCPASFTVVELVRPPAGLVLNRKEKEVDCSNKASVVLEHVTGRTVNICNIISPRYTLHSGCRSFEIYDVHSAECVRFFLRT